MSADTRSDVLGERRAEVFKLVLSGGRVGSTVGILTWLEGLIVIVSGPMRERPVCEHSRL